MLLMYSGQIELVGDAVDVQWPNRIHVRLCLCYQILSAEVDVLKGLFVFCGAAAQRGPWPSHS